MGKVTQQQREIAWNELQIIAAQGKTQPFYREVNKLSLMYSGGLGSNPVSSSALDLLPAFCFFVFLFN
jgi:hypothetical protein